MPLRLSNCTFIGFWSVFKLTGHPSVFVKHKVDGRLQYVYDISWADLLAVFAVRTEG